MNDFEFMKKHLFEDRIKESQKIRTKYPNRIPVIIEPIKRSQLKKIDKNKFLVPDDLTIGGLLVVIRKRINLGSENALFLFINSVLPATSQSIISLYDNHKNKDGFLYISYTEENTFGQK